MDKFLKIAGIVLVVWVALGLLGFVFKFLVSTVFWVALIAGGVYLAVVAVNRSKEKSQLRR